MTSRLTWQIIVPIQQWLLEQGKCLACGRKLRGGEVIKCPCGESYLRLPRANLLKKLTANKYAES